MRIGKWFMRKCTFRGCNDRPEYRMGEYRLCKFHYDICNGLYLKCKDWIAEQDDRYERGELKTLEDWR
jgi:hypothetical protein